MAVAALEYWVSREVTHEPKMKNEWQIGHPIAQEMDESFGERITKAEFGYFIVGRSGSPMFQLVIDYRVVLIEGFYSKTREVRIYEREYEAAVLKEQINVQPSESVATAVLAWFDGKGRPANAFTGTTKDYLLVEDVYERTESTSCSIL